MQAERSENIPVPGVSAENQALNRIKRHIAISDGNHEEITVEAPFTGKPFGTVPRGTEADVEEAAHRARQAQKEWAKSSFEDRAKVFLRFHDLVLGRQAEVLDLIQRENGKARKHAFEEVLDTAITSRYYANTAETHLKPRRRSGALPLLTTTREYHHPLGLAGFIVPWNYPLSLGITDAVPALLAGNSVTYKTG